MDRKSIITILAILIIPVLAFWGLTLGVKSDSAVAQTKGKAQILKFSSTMCLECKQVEKVFEEIMPKYKDKIDYKEVIVDNRDDMKNKLIEKYDISLVPTVILLNSDGSQCKRIEGAIPKEKMEGYIKELK